MKKNAGFSLYEMLIVMLIISIGLMTFIPLYFEKMKKEEAHEYARYINSVVDALQRYQYHSVTVELVNPGSPLSWPNDLEGLMANYTGLFWTPCSEAEQAQSLCKRPDRILWTTTKLGYRTKQVMGASSIAYLTVTMPPQNTPEYHQWLGPLGRLPHARILSGGNVEIKIQDVMLSKTYRDFLKRDGSNTLTDDWDVGGDFAIVNAKDVTVRNSDGTQRSLAGTEFIVANHNDHINKHACPSGLTPSIITSVKGVFNETSVPTPLNNLGAIRSYSIDDPAGDGWIVQLDYWADVKNVKTLLHDGEVNVQLICQLTP